MSVTTLDARRKLCPIPVIKTQQAIKSLAPGDTLQVIATDPGVKHDIPVWCRLFGHEVVEIIEQEDDIIITILVGSDD